MAPNRAATLLTRFRSENAVVARGVKAVNMIYNMIARIPHLMKQSHLESSEGRPCALPRPRRRDADISTSLVCILAAHLPGPHDAVHQPMPRSPPSGVDVPAEVSAVSRAHMQRPRGMDRHLWRGSVPAHLQAAEARGLPVGPQRHERDEGAGRLASVQGLPAVPCSLVQMGRNAGPLGQDHRHHGQAYEQWPRRQLGRCPFPPSLPMATRPRRASG